MKVSCILASYNRPRLVRQAIKSVADQTHRDYELLVFDDSTVFDIAAVVAEFRLTEVKVVHNQVNKERRRSECRLGINCNEGLAAAKGDLFCFLCDDDYFYSTWFASAVRFFSDVNNAGKKVGFGRLLYSSSMAMTFPQDGHGLFYKEPVADPVCRLDHNQVIHRRLDPPGRWPFEFGHAGNPDAVYFNGIAKMGNLFYPIDAHAVVKRLHAKSFQATIHQIGTPEGETERE